MKLFSCPNCGHRLYFENAKCLACGTDVLYDPATADMLPANTPGIYICANAAECSCNWATAEGQPFCRACRLNKTIPDLSIAGNRQRWTRVEAAKKRAIYSLLAYDLSVGPKQSPDDEVGIGFDFLAPATGAGPGGEHILTGHDRGLITLNVAEADSAEREKMRVQMGEQYRTLLGHFRHELGHYYWDRLIRDDPARLAEFRSVFGDESVDYEEALRQHYANGAPPDWQDNHISAYATSHPWEDWAESWAHYIHITDTLEMVHALNLGLGRLDTDPNELAKADTGGLRHAAPNDRPPTWLEPFDVILERWMVLSEASNSINRCMGLPDLYPFVISGVTAGKLGFVHRLLEAHRASTVANIAA
jgi:hypothetical protein